MAATYIVEGNLSDELSFPFGDPNAAEDELVAAGRVDDISFFLIYFIRRIHTK